MQQDHHFGEHLMIDGYMGSSQKLDDEKLTLSVLQSLPSYLGMKPLSLPQVFRASANNLKDPGGWSGFVVIQESHISIHTFPARCFVSIDVYTCKNGLDTEKVCEYFRKAYDLKDLELNFVKRGTRYPEFDIAHE